MNEIKNNETEQFYRKYFSRVEFMESLIWVYSAFGAASMAFFLALFSAGERVNSSFALHICIYLFSFSLIVNSYLAFLITLLKKKGDLLFKFYTATYFRYVPICAILSFTLAVAFLISSYSIVATIISIILCLTMYVLVRITFIEIAKRERSEHNEEV